MSAPNRGRCKPFYLQWGKITSLTSRKIKKAPIIVERKTRIALSLFLIIVATPLIKAATPQAKPDSIDNARAGRPDISLRIVLPAGADEYRFTEKIPTKNNKNIDRINPTDNLPSFVLGIK